MGGYMWPEALLGLIRAEWPQTLWSWVPLYMSTNGVNEEPNLSENVLVKIFHSTFSCGAYAAPIEPLTHRGWCLPVCPGGTQGLDTGGAHGSGLWP